MTKPIDFTQTKAFQNVFAKMQIQPDKPENFHYQPYKFSDDVWNNPLWNGIAFTPWDLHGKGCVYQHEGFFYQGKRVIAYWSKQALYEGRPRELTELAYTYHLTWCKDLVYLIKQVPNKKVLTVTCNVRPELPIEIYDRKGQLQRTERRIFRPCPHCLDKLDWKGYRLASIQEKLKIAWDFYLKEYLQQE